MKTETEKELRELFQNQSDCYTISGTEKDVTSEQALSEDKFVEIVIKILNGVIKKE